MIIDFKKEAKKIKNQEITEILGTDELVKLLDGGTAEKNQSKDFFVLHYEGIEEDISALDIMADPTDEDKSKGCEIVIAGVIISRPKLIMNLNVLRGAPFSPAEKAFAAGLYNHTQATKEDKLKVASRLGLATPELEDTSVLELVEVFESENKKGKGRAA